LLFLFLTSVLKLKLSSKANLILSEGEGVDSYLHQKNRKFAIQVINYLFETCVHQTPLESKYREDAAGHIQ